MHCPYTIDPVSNGIDTFVAFITTIKGCYMSPQVIKPFRIAMGLNPLHDMSFWSPSLFPLAHMIIRVKINPLLLWSI